MKTRFELEDAIMQCWGITNELETLEWGNECRKQPLSQDELAMCLLGLQHVYDLKFERLFDVFKQVHGLDEYREKNNEHTQ